RSRGTLPSCRTPPAGHNCARASLRRPTTPMARFLFPRWANKVVPMGLLFGVLPLGAAVIGGFWYYGTNKHVEVGYQPDQPVDYSHKLHAGDLGMDCRYCHNTVEVSGFAAVPPTETCMNCHAKV